MPADIRESRMQRTVLRQHDEHNACTKRYDAGAGAKYDAGAKYQLVMQAPNISY
jgi:hypothetical protein